MKKIIILSLCLLTLTACASTTRYLLAENHLYRDLRIDSWVDAGGDLQVIEETVQRIKLANSDQSTHVDLATKVYMAGNWHYEWDAVALNAVEQQNYAAASAYYMISAYPFLKNDELSTRSYALSLFNYQKSVVADGNYIEELVIPTEKGDAVAYLHLPQRQPSEKLPVVILTNGSDHTIPDLYAVYRDYLQANGWAMVSFDLPGIGSNQHIGITTQQTNFLHQKMLAYLQNEPRVDAGKIALMGSSFSGNAVIKTAFTNADDIVAAVSVCGAVDAPFKKLAFALTQVPQMTKDAFLSRFDMTPEQIIATSDELALSTRYLGKQQTNVPILSINHDGDSMISPPKDMRLMAESSTNGRYVFVTKDSDGGHCADDYKVLPVVMEWLNEVAL